MTPVWTTACPDWADKLKRGASIVPPPIFPERAAEALEVFKALRIVDAVGSPTFGEACDQWVFDVVASVFGAYDGQTGERLITEWFILVPKKNSKSTLAAGIMMTALVLNWRTSAEFSILAPTIEIANNSFSPARDMCSKRADEELSDLMHTQTHVKTITNRVTNATLKVVAADGDTVGGKKSVGVLVDELWIFGSQSDAENMLREATGGLLSRPEGFVIYLTTQSEDPPAGVFLQKLKYARSVRDGEVNDPRFVPIIYEFPQDMIDAGEHLRPENFGIVNPNLGYSVGKKDLERLLKIAQNNGPESLCGFLAKHVNVQIGLRLRSDRWAGADFWESQVDSSLSLDEILRRSDVVEVGLDAGLLFDLFGMSVLGRDSTTGDWLHWCRCWAHPKVLDRFSAEAPRLRDFELSGDLVISEKIGDDVRQIADLIMMIEAAGLLDRVGVDPHGIVALVEELRGRDFDVERVVGIQQGYKLIGAIRDTERQLASRGLWHCPQPLMDWCVSNAKIEPKGYSVNLVKAQGDGGKIDPVIALMHSVALMAMNPKPRKKRYQILFA